MKNLHVAVVGGGGTGAALAHDLALRGFRVTLLERGELTSGTTGRHHGQLHSGARYAVRDPSIARECARESRILRAIAPEAIEFNCGLFIAIDPADEDYCAAFLRGCGEASVPTRLLSAREALALEPNLNPALRLAVQVPDGTIDAWRLPLHFFATAKRNGAEIRTFSEVAGIETAGSSIAGLRVHDHRTGAEYTLAADAVVNAAGVWAGKVAALAGLKVPVSPSPGTMVAMKGRIVNMVISRLRPPGDGDAVVPQRNLSIIGTTETLAEDPDAPCEAHESDVSTLLANADTLIPGFSRAPFHAAWAAARPLAGSGGAATPMAASCGTPADFDAPGGATSGEAPPGGAPYSPAATPSAASPRELSRDFVMYDHAERDGLEGFLTITGGKATVLRAMAEAAADRLCGMFGMDAACQTAATPLLHYRGYFRERRREGEKE